MQPSRISNKKNGCVKAYAANTNQGLVRNYNEDRVSIVLSITKPPEFSDPKDLKCSLFAIYDGHGGVKCAEFLRDNFYQYLIKDSNFPSNPILALKNACNNSEKAFLNLAESMASHGSIERSGSCAIIILIIKDICYCANVGDSRAIFSSNNGKMLIPLSRDHKPGDEQEQIRVTENGGRIYSNSTATMAGPLRVFPGRLSVARSFGDIEAKLSRYGGNSRVIIAEPEILQIQINSDSDYIFLGSDGIYDKLSNDDINQCIWHTVKNSFKEIGNVRSIHDISGAMVEAVVNLSLVKNSLDNVTGVIICLPGMKKIIKSGEFSILPKNINGSSGNQLKNHFPISQKQMEGLFTSKAQLDQREKVTLSKSYLNSIENNAEHNENGTINTIPPIIKQNTIMDNGKHLQKKHKNKPVNGHSNGINLIPIKQI